MSMKKTFWCGFGLLAGIVSFAQSSVAGPQYDQNLDKTFTVAPGGQLVISADMGPIHVVGGSADKLEIHVLRRVEGGSQDEADRIFARHEVTIAQDGNTVSVIAKNNNRNSGRENLSVSYEVVVPLRFDLELKTAGGDIHLDDLDGKLAAHTTSGLIRAGKITGSLDAKDAGGDITVKEVGQDARASTTSGSIGIEKVGGTTEASDAGGDIHVAEATGDLSAQTTSGSISIGSASGEVKAKDAGGDIHIDTANGNVDIATTSGSLRIGLAKGETLKAEDRGGDIEIGHADSAVKVDTTSGSIKIKFAGGLLKARDAGGDIIIDEAAKDADVRTSSGSIRIGSAQGKVEARNAGGDIHIDNAGAAVNAETSSGTIDVVFSAQPKDDSELAVAGGNINASVPPNVSLDIDAVCQGGGVESELPLPVQGSASNGTFRGQLNGGGPRLNLHCSSGDIHLKASSARAMAREAQANH
jgi:DUF4097 and DUF4098 domain-containing protein YvlB